MPNRLKSSAASYMASGARRDVGNATDCLIVCSPTCPIPNWACPIKICKCFIRKTSLWWNFCTFCSRCWRCFCSCACFPLFALVWLVFLVVVVQVFIVQVRRHACRLLQISSSFLARHTSISARTARPGRHRSRCWSLIYMHKFCMWFAPVYDALI